jgi:hypothetical protein
MVTNNLTYRDIVNQFQSACDAHLSIAKFESGTLDYLDATAVDKLYPYIFLRPTSANLADRVRTLSFELYSLDIPKLSAGSNIEVLSNTEMYIYDLMAWFKFGQTNIQQSYDIVLQNILPVNEAFQDRVFGWVSTINVTTPFKLDYCNYPQV